MSSRPAAADRAAWLSLQLGFWIPLLLCTWLALTPSPPEGVFRVSDILLHLFAFTYLTFALGLARPALRLRWVAAWMLAFGVMIEVVQSFQATRVAELKDVLVDAAGIALGLLLLAALGNWSRKTVRTVWGMLLPG
ncbi:MAG: VanZ family protein [Pseudomonadales bacterium]